jgi:hypothetical protein
MDNSSKVAIAFVVMFFLFAIVSSLSTTDMFNPQQAAPSVEPPTESGLPPRFNRFIDEEAGVVCWCVYDGTIGGLSCLSLSSTKLGQ